MLGFSPAESERTPFRPRIRNIGFGSQYYIVETETLAYRFVQNSLEAGCVLDWLGSFLDIHGCVFADSSPAHPALDVVHAFEFGQAVQHFRLRQLNTINVVGRRHRSLTENV